MLLFFKIGVFCCQNHTHAWCRNGCEILYLVNCLFVSGFLIIMFLFWHHSCLGASNLKLFLNRISLNLRWFYMDINACSMMIWFWIKAILSVHSMACNSDSVPDCLSIGLDVCIYLLISGCICHLKGYSVNRFCYLLLSLCNLFAWECSASEFLCSPCAYVYEYT